MMWFQLIGTKLLPRIRSEKVAPSGQQRHPPAIEQVIGFSVQHLLSLTPSVSYNMLSEKTNQTIQTLVGVHGFKGSGVQGCILVPGLHIGCVFSDNML